MLVCNMESMQLEGCKKKKKLLFALWAKTRDGEMGEWRFGM